MGNKKTKQICFTTNAFSATMFYIKFVYNLYKQSRYDGSIFHSHIWWQTQPNQPKLSQRQPNITKPNPTKLKLTKLNQKKNRSPLKEDYQAPKLGNLAKLSKWPWLQEIRNKNTNHQTHWSVDNYSINKRVTKVGQIHTYRNQLAAPSPPHKKNVYTMSPLLIAWDWGFLMSVFHVSRVNISYVSYQGLIVNISYSPIKALLPKLVWAILILRHG